MPFVVQKTNQCPASRPYGVFTETSHGSGKTAGKPHGCFPSQAKAREQQKALYVNVPDARSDNPGPPNLRTSDSDTERCQHCKMFFTEDDEGKCWGYGNWDVQTDWVCDSFSPEDESESKAEKGPTEVPMTATASPVLTPHTGEWRRERALALSESQRKRTEPRQVHAPLELREATDDGKRVLRSYASLFNESYVVRAGGYRFKETVLPGAFKRTLGTSPDVVFRTEHSGPPLAATWSGDLRLGEDERGLWYEVDLDESDPDVNALISKVQRGVYRESSFAFRIPQGGDRWNDSHDERDVTACELDRGDVSVVTFGASRGTGRHMQIRGEEIAALQEIGFENFVAAFVEWRDFTLLSKEQRVGKVISSQSAESLRQVLSLISDAEDAAEEAEAMLSDFLGVPNPDEEPEDKDVTSAEQLDHTNSETAASDEERNDPTYEDYDVMYALKNAKLALACAEAAQLQDPDHDSDPDDKAVMGQIQAACTAINSAIVAQAQDGRRDPEGRAAASDVWDEIFRLAEENGQLFVDEDGNCSVRFSENDEDEYWLNEDQSDIPEEERADLSTSGRKAMAKSGTAMPDGSFPIPNVAYLKRAIQAFGRAKNKPAVKAWIKRRAAALGATKLIPESWRSEEVAEDKTTERSAPRPLLPENDTDELLYALRARSI